MSEALFHERVDNLFLHVEEILDEADSDIDFVNSSGLLTISCENKSQVILSRQPPSTTNLAGLLSGWFAL